MGRAKALLLFDRTPLVEHLAAQLLAGGCERVIVVVGGRWADAVSAAVGSNPRVSVVVNPDPTRGMLSSLQEGLRAARSDIVVFTPVDLPLGGSEPVAGLLEQTPAGAPVAAPTFEGRAGHPVLLRKRAIDALLMADPTTTTRSVLSPFSRHEVPTGDPGVCGNMNTPRDAATWMGETNE